MSKRWGLTSVALLLLGVTSVYANGIVGLRDPHENVFVAIRASFPEGAEVSGIRFYSNDATVFSEVLLASDGGGRWLPHMGAVLRSVPNVAGISGYVSVAFSTYVTSKDECLWAIVRLPDNAPLQESGFAGGTGIGWRERPGTADERSLFSVDGHMNEFKPAFDISFVTTTRGGSKSAGTLRAPPDPEIDHTVAHTFLGVAFPNPARSVTRIEFGLGREMPVRLSIYNVAGRRVRNLARGTLPAGSHERAWRGLDDRGMPVASGIYILTLQADQKTFRRKLLFIK